MALIYCVECGGKVSTRVEVCIHCGSPVEPPTPQINCPDCGEDFAGSLEACPVCGGPVVVPESSEELSEPSEEQDEPTVTGEESPEVMDVPHILYHENGQILMKGTKRNGELHGPCVTYYKDGKVSQRGIFKRGEKCGEWIEEGKTVNYPPCSGDEVIKQAAQPSQQVSAGGSGQVSNQGPRADPKEPESVATKDEPFNNFVALTVGAFVFQIARELGISWGALTAIFFVIPTYLLTKYGEKQSPQVYAGIIALCFAVLVIAVIGN